MNQRQMQRYIWDWLYGYALNIADNEAFMDFLIDELGRMDEYDSLQWGQPYSEVLTDAENKRLEKAAHHVAAVILGKT